MNPQTKYELHLLEQIFVDLQEAKNRTTPTVIDEVERIKQALVKEVFNFEDERHLERYIQYHQQALIRVMDKCVNFIGSNSHQEQVDMFYQGLEELLNFIERHFTKYFDQDAKAPESYITIARKDTRLNLKRIQKALITQNADAKIIELFLHPLRRILKDNPHKDTTYRKVIYAKEIQKEILRILNHLTPTMDVNEELRLAMYYLNYNSAKTLAYFAHHINFMINEVETHAEKMERLSFMLKTINQSQIKPGIHYNLHAHPLKDQLNEYITIEINYFERLQNYSGGTPGRPFDSFLLSFKLKFEMSVAQLAYLIRIFTEIKLIQNSNLTETIRFIARFVVTKRTEAVSFDSFRSKFYNVEQSTRISVRQLLLSAVHYIEKDT